MPWYRLYVRDRDGHFGGVSEFEAIDAAQAINRIDRSCHGLACELWHDQTMIRRWDEHHLVALWFIKIPPIGAGLTAFPFALVDALVMYGIVKWLVPERPAGPS